MTSVSQSLPVAGPVFVRQLAQLAGGGAGAGHGPPLATTLAQWIDWHRAVTLAGALDGRLPDPAVSTPDPGIAADCARHHALLREAIHADPALAPRHGAAAAADPDAAADADFAPLRARYLGHQRTMLATTGRLRGQLRDLLGAIPRLARLGAVDAALEQALAPREHALLGGLPDLLARRFDHLREQSAAADAPDHAWLDRFRFELRNLLLAELDLRFSPIQALLAALAPADPMP